MGIGDNIMGSGLGRGANARGKKIAFGDGPGTKIRWDGNSETVFKNNQNIARPGEEGLSNLEWVKFYKGHRQYNAQDSARKVWVWHDFRPMPGEFFFGDDEWAWAAKYPLGFVLIEPNVPWQKGCAENKDWGVMKYQAVADRLIAAGLRVCQFNALDDGESKVLAGVEIFPRVSFREVVVAMDKASLYVGPEGGLHHAAAAMDLRAVVLFGGFIPPRSTGYGSHVNLTGSEEACGNYEKKCDHCRRAMDEISVETVTQHALDQASMYRRAA